MIEPEVVYRAKFEHWILPRDHKGSEIGAEPKGPFEIEVFNAGSNNKPHWRARLMPTGQWFGGRQYRTYGECQKDVSGNFRKQVQPWREAKPFDSRQTSFLDGLTA